jgi:hypothetical protein
VNAGRGLTIARLRLSVATRTVGQMGGRARLALQCIHLSGKRYDADAMQEAAARADQPLDEVEAVH